MIKNHLWKVILLRKSIVLFVLIFSFIYPLISQNSINNQITEDGNFSDSLGKVYHFHSLANNYKNTNLDLAIFYNKKALTLANKIKSPEACAITNELMGELFHKNHSLQPSINYYLISARIYENNDDNAKLAGVYIKLGELYLGDNFNIEKTQDYYHRSLGLAIEIGDKDLMATVYNRIAGVFHNQLNYDESLEFYLKAYDLWTSINNEEGIARALNNIGEIYRSKNDHIKAYNYYEKSYEINNRISSLRQKAVNLENMGMIKSAQANTTQAFEFYEESLKLYTENNLQDDKLQLLILIGKEYLKIGMATKSYDYFYEAYMYSRDIGDLPNNSEAALGLSNALELMGDDKSSLKYYKVYSQIKDSIVVRLRIEQQAITQAYFLNDLNIKQIELNQHEIALLENQKRIDTINLRFMVFGIFVIIGLAILVVWRQRLKAKKESEIKFKDIEIHKAKNKLMEIELKSKDNDLINFALHLIQKNKVLHQLKTDLKTLSNSSDEENAKRLRDLSYHVQQSLQVQKEMEEFQKKVDQTYSDFFIKLKDKYPSLTKNEERLCAMLRLNLSSKEIASLNNISIKAVEMSRYRLRKKCGIENSEILPEFLNKL